MCERQKWVMVERGKNRGAIGKVPDKMRKIFLLVGLLGVAGCQASGKIAERADDPMLAPSDQQRKARYLHAFPDEELAPRTGVERPGPHSR